MSQEFTVQCQNCGTLYPGIHDVCPYCGEPQLLSEPDYDDDLPPDEELIDDEAYDEPYQDQEQLEDEGYPLDELYAGDEEYDDEAYDEIYEDEYDDEGYDETYDEIYDDDAYDEDEYDEDEIEERPHRVWPRVLLGCLGMLLCALVFYGSIGVFATYQGWQERTSEIQTRAEDHYQRGQDKLANDQIELAIAEFEEALRLNPNLLAAREALREAERIVQSRPTPTSETRSAAAESLLAEAENFINQESWAEAADKLSQVKDLDPDFQPDHISELIYQANYQWGLQLITPAQIDQALQAFETALAERPDDTQVVAQTEKASRYIEGTTAIEAEDYQTAIEALNQLYEEDNNYLDVQQQLANAYVELGDEYAAEKEWCDAEEQYIEAVLLQPDDELRDKSEQSSERCQELAAAEKSTDTPVAQTTKPARATSGAGNTSGPAVKATDTPTATVTTGQGKILFSMFNPFESRWEIMSIPSGGGTPEVVTINGTMPALSPNGNLLVYHSELIESEGFHTYDLTSGQDQRITLVTRHILPRWGGDNKQFIFVAEEPGTGRWQVHQGFADGKSDPIILRDGRTADLSSDNRMIAYQGTDPEGNNPGIYLAPFGGGEETRLTNHESDRSPAFSPDGSQLAYMSTRNGNWDIYVVSTEGSAPRQITTASGQDGLPVWSPDGTRIAYVSDADGSWAIYTVAVNGGGKPFKVTEWDGNRPDWLLAQIWWAR